MRNETSPRQQAALLGIGLDADDGQKRMTRGENYVLFGGSEETHGRMQETAVKINEHLDRSGRRLHEVSKSELRDICNDVNP